MEQEELAVWMRTAPTTSFWKLHRIIDDGLKAGTYTLSIGINFPVRALIRAAIALERNTHAACTFVLDISMHALILAAVPQ